MSAPRSSLFRPDPSDRYGSPNPSSSSVGGDHDGHSGGGAGGAAGADAGDSYYTSRPTYATFSPVPSLSGGTTAASSAAKRRSIILVHQKSPLLLATPPQITRALAYSHPYILPLNKLAGLLSWTTGDPWESFLVVIAWWLAVMYADTMVRLAGPVFLVLTLIAGMYGRRYSPLSTSGWSNEDGSTGSTGNSGGGSSSSKSTNTGGGSGGSAGSGGGGLGYYLFGFGGGSANSSSGSARDATTANRTPAKNQSLDSAGASSAAAGKGSSGGGNASLNAPSGGRGRSGSGHQRSASELITNTRHQKTLDEIVETLREFTARCNLLLEPLLALTDFLSTQSTPISATTRPALTVLFVRILLCTPFWFLLTLPPLRLITTRRVALVFGTLILTWHSRAMRVSRTILWRSATIRRAAALVTGLEFEGPMKPSKAPPYVTAGGPGTTAATAAAALQSKLSSTKPGRRPSSSRESELTKAIRRARAGNDTGVRFTFILYENQRRWVGLGWTTSLFAYERPAWTDEHNNAVPSKDEFELPEVEDGSNMRWRWVAGGRWRVDGVMDEAVRVEKTGPHGEHKDTWDYDGDGGRMGWVYYDNKWQNGRRGQDGWTRWTRRRKWYRDAELVEVDDDNEDVSPPKGNKTSGEGTNNGGSDAGESSGSTPTAESPTSLRTGGPPPGASDSVSSSTTLGGVPIDKAKAGHNEKGTSSADGSLRDGVAGPADGGNEGASDAASILSTSSRSTRVVAPSLRRHVTDASTRGAAAPAVTTAAVAMAMPTASGISSGHGGSSASWGIKNPRRRGSEEQEEEAAMLSSSVGVRLDDGGDKDGWGYGDEARMGLD